MLIAKPFFRYLRPAIRATYHSLYRTMLPLHWWLVDRLSHDRASRGFPLPPAKLRFRVGESSGGTEFLQVGERTFTNIESSLADAGYRMDAFKNVLDLGCGCGRTLIWLVDILPAIHWHGTDVDAEAIEWCRENIPKARFTVNAPLPPLPYPDSAFDFVYAISVFTHLDEKYQRAWIPELARVIKRDGLLLVTFHSEHVWKRLSLSEEIEREGIVVSVSAKLRGVVPDWYQTTFQTPIHLLNSLSTHFTIVRHVSRGFGDQDAVIALRE